MAWCSKDLFPTKLSFVYFISYMGLFINQGILVTASKNSSNTYSYNTVTVVLLTECLKLFVAVAVYLKEILIVFKKKLSYIQWASLIFLTLGCIIKEYGRVFTSETSSTTETGVSAFFDRHLILIMVQVFCSCFAGVYNEYLLKGRGSDIHIMMQNVFMYVDSIVCNVIALGYKGQLTTAFTTDNISSIFQVTVICIMINNAAIGIVVSLFLRSLNSILKTFASALELLFTAVLCWIIFGIAIDWYTVLAILIVTAATFLYAQNPVVNKPQNEVTHLHENGHNKEETLYTAPR
ncbi:SENJU-like protein [Mya arenaria]|uniref:SENJU-like protein n=1 Tax=Mya arenaria TaxID=6604 RepID=A0ABY7FCQ1_MYAAR|nr:SENJU-like protein [Mya arenaria]